MCQLDRLRSLRSEIYEIASNVFVNFQQHLYSS